MLGRWFALWPDLLCYTMDKINYYNTSYGLGSSEIYGITFCQLTITPYEWLTL
jgi:hypothetical protein